MCRMIASPQGIPGKELLVPFLRMARGRNTTNEWNRTLGDWPHPDGWGGVFRNGSCDQRIRGSLPCWEDKAIDTLMEHNVFLLHARKASVGGTRVENVHPFQAEISGDVWSFCHNGTVRQSLAIPPTLEAADPTDSETVFHQLLPYIREDHVLTGLREVLVGIRAFSGLNIFILGPDVLWTVCLHASTPDYFTLHLADSAYGPIVSSEPLPELASHYEPLSNGEILRVDRATGRVDRLEL